MSIHKGQVLCVSKCSAVAKFHANNDCNAEKNDADFTTVKKTFIMEIIFNPVFHYPHYFRTVIGLTRLGKTVPGLICMEVNMRIKKLVN